MIQSRICLLFLCYRLLDLVDAQLLFTSSTPLVPTAGDFIRRAFHSCKSRATKFFRPVDNQFLTIVVGDFLYIDGGELWQMAGGNMLWGWSKLIHCAKRTVLTSSRHQDIIY